MDAANRLSVHPCVWLPQWTADDAASVIGRAHDAGFGMIIVPLRNPEEVACSTIVRALDANGMTVANALALSPDEDIASADPAVASRGEARIMDAIALARDMGSSHIGGPLTQALTKHPAAPDARGRGHAIEILVRAADRAAEAGVRLAIEVVNRYESSFVNTAEQARSVIDTVGSDNLFIHLDTYHMNIEERDWDRAIQAAGDRLIYFEVGENHRGALGTGLADVRGALRALARSGYSGPIGFEAFSAATLSEAIAGNLAIWRTMWDDGDAVAREAAIRIRAEWRSACAIATGGPAADVGG